MENELRQYQIDPNLVASIFDADEASISELSLLLLERIIQARELTGSGETHLGRRGLAIPEKLIDWLICCALDAMSWNDDLYITRDLIVLIRERLGGANVEYQKAIEVHQNKSNAAMAAGQIKAQGVKPTFKLLGKIFGVAPSTVKRWFEPGEFEREVDRWARMFDSTGRLIPLAKRPRVAREK